ncbi:hypothetical protein RHSIM_Rhsim02G0094800 [Rhododendron simsii]|uniref:Uncharacterized protein n=1 Tax=Rhododendron simsii TaxID=118357 RepID=A0A834LSL6_RHOSS|nr:hypothetical protein RHSIM_Rhsim02G0094800 [Rhododendron simsii]
MDALADRGFVPGMSKEDRDELARSETTAIRLSNVANMILFAAKVYASFRSGSLAIIASTLDSLIYSLWLYPVIYNILLLANARRVCKELIGVLGLTGSRREVTRRLLVLRSELSQVGKRLPEADKAPARVVGHWVKLEMAESHWVLSVEVRTSLRKVENSQIESMMRTTKTAEGWKLTDLIRGLMDCMATGQTTTVPSRPL